METEKTYTHKTTKPSTEGKTAAQYTEEMLKYHREQYGDKQPPETLKWIGDAALAVPPKGRLGSAVGLVGGLIAGVKVSDALMGQSALTKEAVKPMKGLGWLRELGAKWFPKYDVKGVDKANKNLYALHMAVYSLGGILGSLAGVKWGYADRKEQNRNPQYVEDYLTAVSHHEGDTWAVLASAPASILASASGMWAWGLPVPGLNYGLALSGYITSMQDRNTMIPHLNEMVSGAVTPSYLRLKEGAHYLCEYAVGNPSKEPVNMEYLAYTILGPLFKDKLTAEHIKTFTDTVQEVRERFMDETGKIPAERRKEAVQTMKEVFTGAGLEVLLIDMGLNPATIPFDHVNGLMGKIGDIGQAANIKKEQNAYWEALQKRLPKYVEAGEISEERASWVLSGIEAMKQGKQPPAPPSTEQEHFHTCPSGELDKDGTCNRSHDHTLSRNSRFAANASVSLGANIRKDPIRHLIDSATGGRGDWRSAVIGEQQSVENPILIN